VHIFNLFSLTQKNEIPFFSIQIRSLQGAGGGRAESKAESKPTRDGGEGGGAKSGAKSSSGMADAKPSDIPEPALAHIERSQSRSGTRSGRPDKHSSDTGLGGFGAAASMPNLDSEIERCDGSEATTQAILGAIITRPKLTEKLLGKPPFRFLFDIVVEVIRATGFASTLYSAEELDPANATEKAQKLMFLEKIIKLVGLQLNTIVGAKPARIIGGYDPQDTNNFLQLLAVAAKHLPDSREAARTVLAETGGGDVGGGGAPATSAPPRAEEKPSQRAASDHAEPKRQAPAPEPAGASSSNKSVDDRRELVAEERVPPSGDGGEGGEENKKSARPTTARRRPPKVRDGAKELAPSEVAPAPKKTMGIMVDGQGDDDDEDGVQEERRLADDVKAESKSSAGGEPQSKLVRDIMGRQAEQEAARKAGAATVENKEVAEETKGDTEVGGIRLGKLRKTGADKKGATGSTVAPGSFGESEIERLRGAIQVLVQHTGPLGTSMDYVQEDLSLMTQELQRWEEECRRHEVEVETEKRKTKEVLQPLQAELAEIEEQLHEHTARILSTKASIARNDERINQILKLVASS
jgi:TRAF3-interacting protein 1